MSISKLKDRSSRILKIPNPPAFKILNHGIELLSKESTPDGRYYEFRINGVRHRLKSVTTWLGQQQHSWLDEWRAKVGNEYADRVTRLAGSRGTLMHAYIEKYIQGVELKVSDLNPGALSYFLPIIKYLDKIEEIYLQESFLFSLKHKLAGTTDLFAKYAGKLSVVDYKSSSEMKDESQIEDYFTQCKLYADMIYEIFGIQVEQAVILMSTHNTSKEFIRSYG